LGLAWDLSYYRGKRKPREAGRALLDAS